ncbi:PREDICTED: frizzled-7-B-like [Papilio polytes]|uniref:frizzled-7-B-like n=1 Tax=Papilio polytes TaxID=76194 RepID=UPI000675DCE4|nr:PREDICTED: frizzled-7-B-like [Papilio polytes]
MGIVYVSFVLPVFYLFVLTETSRVTVYQGDSLPHHGRCEPITIPLCQNIRYNQTIFPNILNHAKQSDASQDVLKFTAFIKVNCSPDLKFFLCAVYAPLCTILENPIPPCRHLCESAKHGCHTSMFSYGFPWPENLKCSSFPVAGKGVLCFGDNNGTQELRQRPETKLPKVDFKANIERNPTKLHGARDIGFVCPIQFKISRNLDLEYSLKVGDKVEKDCGAPCNGIFFSQDEKNFARLWIGIWATLCTISCLFTVLTFLIDTDRFRYPERPIIFLSVCYLMVAASYVMGWGAGDSVSCQGPFPPTISGTRLPNISVITQGTKHEPCTILFMVVYFFSMASSIWWVILTLTWFLAAGLKWGHEAIEANSQYFHLAAWAVPAIKTISILAMGKVDGDILSGVCYVGLWDAEALQGFVLSPLCAYLVLGTIFLLAGFVSLFRIRTVMKHDGTKTDKLEKLMIRIGVFGVLYTVPALIVIACLFYEYVNFDSWMVTWHRDLCTTPMYSIPCPFTYHDVVRPKFEMFMIKYLMTMIVGITSSFWIWSNKTLVSWHQFFDKIRGRRVEAYV